MFKSLRWKFTAWYVCASVLAILIVGSAIFLIESRAVSHRIDGSIRSAGDAARAATAANLQQDGFESPMLAAERAIDTVAAHVGLSAQDVFVLLLDTSGQVRANPDRIHSAALTAGASLDGALSAGEHWHTVEVADSRVRVKTFPLMDGEQQPIGYVVAGKSMEDGEAAIRTLVMVMAGSAALGVALFAIGGYFVAGMAIRPVQASYERQRQFISNASHELRTPLTVIRTNAGSLLRRHRDEPAVQDIEAEARYMGSLIDNLLLLAEGDARRLQAARSEVDLSMAARSAEMAARPLASESNVSLSFQGPGAVPVMGDSDRLRQVLLVLLDNALKFTPPGGSVTLVVRHEGGDAIAEVQDNGPGMTPHELSRATDRFFSGSKARSRSRGGTGLGLSIATEIMAAMDGRLELESTAGRGTTARLRLPLAPPKAQESVAVGLGSRTT